MKHLHNISVYYLTTARRWVIKLESISKPIKNASKVTVQRMFLTQTAFNGLLKEIKKYQS